MAVISNKNSKSHKRNRRGHIAISLPSMIMDKTTGEYRISHRVSPSGAYKGKKVVEVKQNKK